MTDTRGEFSDLQGLYLPIAIVVLVLVAGVVLFALVRYRARPGRVPSERTELPSAELAWVGLLAVVVVVLVVATFRTESKVDAVAGPGLRVDVTVAQWRWRFTYPGTGVSDAGTATRPATLHVPAGTVVRLRMTSRDVIHAFFVPALRFKRDAFPRRFTTFDLVWRKPGFDAGECAEFCGLHHSDMGFVVDAMAPADFKAWLAGARG